MLQGQELIKMYELSRVAQLQGNKANRPTMRPQAFCVMCYAMVVAAEAAVAEVAAMVVTAVMVVAAAAVVVSRS